MARRYDVRFFFVLTALGRISVAIGLLERPLVQGLVLGALTGQWNVALPLAIILELFWLDCIRLGAVVPPLSSLGYLAVVPCLYLYPIAIPEQLGVPLLCALGLSLAGVWVERSLRVSANSFIPKVQAWIDGCGGLSPERVVGYSLFMQTGLYAALYVVSFTAVYAALAVLLQLRMLPALPTVSLNMWYGLALLGAVLALRIRRAYVLLGCGLFIICAAHI